VVERKRWFLLGVFEFLGICAWLICGRSVVDCVVKMVCGKALFEAWIFCSFLGFIFRKMLNEILLELLTFAAVSPVIDEKFGTLERI